MIAAVASVLYGIASGDLTRDTTALETADGRFGSVGDPNELAAGLVPAIALAVGLVPGMARGPGRLLVAGSVVVMLLGLAATQSRGGLVAAGVCVLVTMIVAQGRRLAALIITVCVLTVGAFALATTPGALDRVTSADNGGNGRSDLWTVAGRMFADHPANGVGLNHFRVESPDYVRQSGQLESVELIVEDPKLVHNTYLQLLAETGVIGLGLFLVLIGMCVVADGCARRAPSSGPAASRSRRWRRAPSSRRSASSSRCSSCRSAPTCASGCCSGSARRWPPSRALIGASSPAGWPGSLRPWPRTSLRPPRRAVPPRAHGVRTCARSARTGSSSR